jgi:hypothetical protein
MGTLRSHGFNLLRWNSLLDSLDSLIERFKEEGLSLHTKGTINGSGLSQLAFKIEAAGKLRVFALVDSITQSLLSPLHDFLFEYLKNLPNDGTFDQDASVRRSMDKLNQYGISYSFDLSAATDRLPASLTAQIIETLTGVKGIGGSWLSVMTDRDFYLQSGRAYGSAADRIEEFYDKESFRYAVGQPMGSLSS